MSPTQVEGCERVSHYFIRMERESFVIYKSFYEAIKDLPDEDRLVLMDAIMEYGLYGIEPEGLSPVPKCVFTLIKPQLDANNRKYENGKKGGRPRKATPNQDGSEQQPVVTGNSEVEKPKENLKKTKIKPNDNQEETKQKPNVNVNVNVNENEEKNKSSKLDLQKKKVSKEDETIERRKQFYNSLIPFVDRYGKEMIRQFYDYWSEMNKSKSRMRWEGEKTWELERRLEYWSRRDNSYSRNGTNRNEQREQERVGRQSDAYDRIMRLRAQDEAGGGEPVRDDRQLHANDVAVCTVDGQGTPP